MKRLQNSTSEERKQLLELIKEAEASKLTAAPASLISRGGEPAQVEHTHTATGGAKTQAGYLPAVMDFIEIELHGGKSSPVEALAGVLHVNAILYMAGLIPDDTWNQVKGLADKFLTIELIGGMTSSVTTLVEAAPRMAGRIAQLEALAAVAKRE